MQEIFKRYGLKCLYNRPLEGKPCRDQFYQVWKRVNRKKSSPKEDEPLKTVMFIGDVMNDSKRYFLSLFFAFFFPCLFCSGNLLEMDEWSYGNPALASWGEGAKCKVGKFCSIAEGVTIFLGGDHRPDWVTTYPFSVLWEEARGFKGHPRTKGDVIIGNDVWIAHGATIMSGVKIGNGAVIGAKAVVASDVPPYAIVVGNPGRVVKYRFTPEQIEKLQAIAWWDWPTKEIIAAMPLLLNPDIETFIQYCEIKNDL